ncbi:MAG: tetratricopeptide repeat protein [Deltaproteobacteria bacterium]|nr:tetratricopeptide repeat protein [Deltaproteobacteria bacterium]
MTAAERKDGGARFCPSCGERLQPTARFCPGCGQAADSAPAAAASLRDQWPGLVVLGVFLAAGLLVWIGVLRPGPAPSSAPGRGRAAAPAGGGAGGGVMPAEHPPVGLPDEAKGFVSQLAEKANAAPQDVAAWKSLAQVQARAAEMDPSYGEQALASWQHVLSIAPADADAIRGLGNAYYDRQKFDLAALQYERYLAKNPDDASVRTDLATTYLYQRQVDKAIAGYQQAIASKPTFLQAHFNLGLAYEAKGEREKAMASLDKARELATDDDTRTRIDRVKTQLSATLPGAAAATIAAGGTAAPPAAGAPTDGGMAGTPAPPHPGVGAPPAGAAAESAAGTDFPSRVEAQLRAHQILGPKIRSIEWPDPTRARVLVADFPMASMPEFARTMFRARLEAILSDTKARFAVTDPRTIEIADAASGTAMETVTK